jgi:hypothetical protein
MTLLDSRRIDDVLADLVAHDVLSTEQARAVILALDADAGEATAAPERPLTVEGAPGPPSTLRARLVEAAAYLGAVLVAAGLVALFANQWGSMSDAARLASLVALAVVAYALGLGAGLLLGGGRATLRTPGHAPRRRVAGVLMAVGAGLGAASVVQLMGGTEVSGFLGALTAIVLLVPAQLLVPSAVTELGLFASSAIAVGVGLDLLVPPRPDTYWNEYYDGGYPAARAWDFLVPGALLVLGLLWASVVSRVLTLPVLAQVVGLLLSLEASIGLATDRSTRSVGLVLLGLLALAGVAVFVRERAWPWLVLTVLSATVAVFVLMSDSGNPALAFLVSGVVLLAGAGGGALLGRRRTPGPV